MTQQSPSPSSSNPPSGQQEKQPIVEQEENPPRLEPQELPLQQQKQQTVQLPAELTLQDCMKLLVQGSNKERLWGLHFLPTVCKPEDQSSILKVHAVLSFRFLDQLFEIGVLEDINVSEDLRICSHALFVQTLVLFCNVPHIASSLYMLSKIPSVLQIMEKETSSLNLVLCHCYELLYAIAFKTNDGVFRILEHGGAHVLASLLLSLRFGSQKDFLLFIKLLELIFVSVSCAPDMINRYSKALFTLVGSIAHQFALLRKGGKFELLHLLFRIFSHYNKEALFLALKAYPNHEWSAYVCTGIVDTLTSGQDFVLEKWDGLMVVAFMFEVLGDSWLINNRDAPKIQSSTSSYRCLHLVLQQTRVEITLLLTSFRRLQRPSPSIHTSSSKTPVFVSDLKKLEVAFFLMYRLSKLILNKGVEDKGDALLNTLTETIGLVLGHLSYTKYNGRKKGDDLLASVKLVGSCVGDNFWQSPTRWRDMVKELMDYMLAVEPENGTRKYLSTSFLLPILSQLTAEAEGIASLASSGIYNWVVNCLVETLDDRDRVEDVEERSSIVIACDLLMAVLKEREQKPEILLDESSFIPLLRAFAVWTGWQQGETANLMVNATIICSMILNGTSERDLLVLPGFDSVVFLNLAGMIRRSLNILNQWPNDHRGAVIFDGMYRWSNRFPAIKEELEGLFA